MRGKSQRSLESICETNREAGQKPDGEGGLDTLDVLPHGRALTSQHLLFCILGAAL